jgi:PAX-interacting protein 1
VNIFNIKQKQTNIPLPLFFDDLKPSKNNRDIYQIETLNYTKVKFKPPRPNQNIPQCSKCQRYGHNQAYCYHSPRCVKCPSSHLNKQCSKKEKSENVKCVLCDSNHPANYKGCAVYKDLQKRTFPPLQSKQDEKNQKVLPQKQITPHISYANTLKPQHNNFQTANPQTQQQATYQQQMQLPPTDIQELTVMMKGPMEQMGTMLNLPTTLVSKIT